MLGKKTLLAALAASAAFVSATPAFAQAAGEKSAVRDTSCERPCLLQALEQHMKALAARDPAALKLAGNVRFTENNVDLKVGEGLWRTVTAVDATGLEAADPITGNAAWFGSVRENGNPAIYAVRIHVKGGRIDEIESVVHRKTALPAPFGDVTKMVHDPEFNNLLPEEERRPRERMLAIADGYFDTVELNDGQVNTHFADDCSRLENGISTTAPPPPGAGGNAAALASGCEAQFKLGIYKINKRIRRHFSIIDTERGVAVASGFFDHANEWDHYKLTDGREMKTALKWPNSISLIEAFRIRNAEIQKIEAVFTYVPYFMHNPYWGPGSEAPKFKIDPKACDAACLGTLARTAVGAMAGNNWQSVPWASAVGYAENSVGIRVGEGIWAGVSAVDQNPLVVADSETGKAVWIGRIEEHGQPAWAAFTVKSAGERVGGIEALIRRKEYGQPYVEPVTAPVFDALPKAEQTARKAMIAGAESFYAAMNAHVSAAPAGLAADCHWLVNGLDVGACAPAFGNPALKSVERIRDREVLAVDESRGLVVYRTFEDFPAANDADKTYPRTLQVTELFHFVSGKVDRVEAWTSELPYGMKPHD
ncbi:MAG: hypothetical protein P0Y56_16560 [Candidatus Andeanibacterium colombiense]|uniref:DUF8021 domain-containing protein n=1 Tax=Candidatus Andeanibacterium colombiense TaxID=3121345 RepID=A0AAJ5X8M8_9SPHN|nr:MAG: hypothetical protein P0Y56_16560 [Sphingomonadaceae bacterium]